MRGWVHDCQTLLGAVALGVGLAGCAAQQGDSLRLSEELGRARADAAWQQARAAEVEARLLRLEQRTGVAQSIRRAEDRELLSRIDRLIEMNERLLAEHAVAQVPTASKTSSAASGVPAASAEQELRALVERMRGRPGRPHGGLTLEQESAVRVLTRPERKLDTENPWPAAIY